MPSVDITARSAHAWLSLRESPNDADGSDGEKGGESMPDCIAQTFPPDFLGLYMVCFS